MSHSKYVEVYWLRDFICVYVCVRACQKANTDCTDLISVSTDIVCWRDMLITADNSLLWSLS